jgi:hypothetical protein
MHRRMDGSALAATHTRRDGTHLHPRKHAPSTLAPAQTSYASFIPPAGELQHEVAEQRELCQKAQAALAAARLQLATLLPIEAELQRERREWQAQKLRWTEAHSPGMHLSRCATPPSPPRCAATPRATTGSRAEPAACVAGPSPGHRHAELASASAIYGGGSHPAELPSPSSVMVALKRLEMTGDHGRCSGPPVLSRSPSSSSLSSSRPS